MNKFKMLAVSAATTMTFAISAGAQACSVGISMYTLGAPYFAAQAETARTTAEAAGCEVSVADGGNSMQEQISDIEDMVVAGIDILILNPRDPEGLVASANMASAQGVHVVAIDNTLNPSADFITQVQSSNTANGNLVGQWLAEELGDTTARIALLSGVQGSLVGRERRLGVLRGLLNAQLTNDGAARIEVLGQGWGGWSTDGGLNAMEDLLTAHSDINIVLGENDSMVLGARSALQAADRLDEVILVAAADGQKEALELIRDGQYGATGLNNPNQIARRAVEIGLQAQNGELPTDMPKLTVTEPAVITQDNVDTYYNPDSLF